MTAHWDTGPLPIAVQTVIDSQPYADEPRPWWRWPLLALVMFVLMCGLPLLMGK